MVIYEPGHLHMHQQYSWKNVHCYAGVVCIHVQKWAQGHNNYGSPTFGDFLYITEVALHNYGNDTIICGLLLDILV